MRNLTSVSQFVALMQRYDIPGPRHLSTQTLENITFYEKIGSGAQFNVYRSHIGEVFKRVHPSMFDPDESQDELRRNLKTLELEVRALCSQRIRGHPNVVKLNAWAYDYSTWMPNTPLPVLAVEGAKCSLQDLLRDPEQIGLEKVPLSVKYHICLDIASGLECLRECGIVHGDLKSANVLVFNHSDKQVPIVAKLNDFGLCVVIEKDQDLSYSRYRATHGWKPPETCMPAESITLPVSSDLLFKCDSYSYGLVALSTMVFDGRSPLAVITRHEQPGTYPDIKKMLEGTLDFGEESNNYMSAPEQMVVAKYCRQLCQQFLSLEPSSRDFVSTQSLADDSKAYRDWIVVNTETQLRNSIATGSSLVSRNYSYWSRLDKFLLRQLQRDYQASHLEDHYWQFSTNTLLGMAMSISIDKPPGYQDKVYEYLEAAASRESNPFVAQAMFPRVCAAIRPQEAVNLQSTFETYLFNASSSGSWMAATQLDAINPWRSKEAKAKHRETGGYNKEAIRCHDRNIGEGPSIVDEESLTVPLELLQSLDLIELVRLPAVKTQNMIIDERQNTLLHIASMLGRVDVIRYLAENSYAQMNGTNAEGETPLYKACLSGHSEAVRILIQFDANPSVAVGAAEITCLHWLFQFEEDERHEIANVLVQHGASISARTRITKNGTDRKAIEFEHYPFQWPHGTPLHWACHVGSIRTARVLLMFGAQVDEPDTLDAVRAFTPLALAAYFANSTMVSFLLDNGADPNRQADQGYTALHMLARSDYSMPSSIRTSRSLDRWLHHGSCQDSIEKVRMCVVSILGAGGRLDQRRNRPVPNTPLTDAADHRDSTAVLALLGAGADPDLADELSYIPLHAWTRIDHDQLAYPETYMHALEALIDHTKNCDARDEFGNSVIHNALGGHEDIENIERVIRVLLYRTRPPVDIDARNEFQETPLLKAARGRGRQHVYAASLTTILVDLGANPGARDEDNCDLIWHLSKNDSIGDRPLLQKLEQHYSGLDRQAMRASLNESRSSKDGRTALMNMVDNGYEECVAYSLALEADLTLTTNGGYTTLDIALHVGNHQRMRLLKQWADHNTRKPPTDIQHISKDLFEYEAFDNELGSSVPPCPYSDPY